MSRPNRSDRKIIHCIVFSHIMLMALSNVLVLYPIQCFSLNTTLGALSYPAIFLITDLTTRIYGPKDARSIVLLSMLPGLVISYGINIMIHTGAYLMAFRIALASFIAYVSGQCLDIFVFQQFRTRYAWWVAPSLSTLVGNILDTLLFFSIAFYQSTDPFMSRHWVEIAGVDMCFKVLISLLGFVPAYGAIMNIIYSLRLKKEI